MKSCIAQSGGMTVALSGSAKSNRLAIKDAERLHDTEVALLMVDGKTLVRLCLDARWDVRDA